MKIAIFSDVFLPKIDGVGISIDQFCRFLGPRGHQFLIFCPAYGDGDFYAIEGHSKIMRFPSIGLPSYPDVKIVLPKAKTLKKAFADFQPDLIHFHSPGIMGLTAAALAKKHALPLVSTYHTLVSEQGMYLSPYRLLKVDKLFSLISKYGKVKKKIKTLTRKKEKKFGKKVIQKLCNRIYQKSDLVITPSQIIRQTLKKEKMTCKMTVISNGLDLSQFAMQAIHKPMIDGSFSLRFVHIGRISHEKNIEVLLDAFNTIASKQPQASLDIYGDGPAKDELQTKSQNIAAKDRITFHGFVPRSQLPTIYPKYDIFLTASTMETQGLVVLEALASGLPCVGVKSYALPELIRHGFNGYCAAPHNADEIAALAMKIATDPGLYNSFSVNAVDTAREHELSHCALRLEKRYLQIHAKSKKKAK